jgi:hypothetical protein
VEVDSPLPNKKVKPVIAGDVIALHEIAIGVIKNGHGTT